MKRCSISKRAGLLLLLFTGMIVLILGLSESVFAAGGKTAKVYHIQYPRSGDHNKEGMWGKPHMNHVNGWKGTRNKGTLLRGIGGYSGTVSYCIEPGVEQESGAVLKSSDEHFFESISDKYNPEISPQEIKLLLGRILTHGYCGNVSLNWYSQNDADADKIAHAYATQLLIWEVVVGERSADFTHIDPVRETPILESVHQTHPLRQRILEHYHRMEKEIKKDSMIPGFCAYDKDDAETAKFRWNGQKYEVCLEDKNNVLENFEYRSSDPGMEIRTDQNVLRVSCEKVPKESVIITAVKKNAVRKGIEVWTDGKFTQGAGTQDVIVHTHEIEDNVQGFVKLKADIGRCEIIKTSEDEKVSGVEFMIEGNGIRKKVHTDQKGRVQIQELLPGTYVVSELTEHEYVPQQKKEIIVESGKCAKVEFHNILKKGTVKVIKESEDQYIAGIRFHLSGVSASGVKIDRYAETDDKGTAMFQEIPISGQISYVLEETNTEERYILPKAEKVTVEWNKVTEKTIKNRLKKFTVDVKKQDSETKKPQGEAVLSGAVYGIYKGETLVDRYETDEDGYFHTREYVCGENWSLREIKPSEGYTLDKAVYDLGAEAEKYTLEYNKISRDVFEKVIKGNIQIVKHMDDGKTQIETPEEGAEFEIFLKSDHSFDKTSPDCRDRIVCDKNGYGVSKQLPYGLYTVHQTRGKEGSEKIGDFDVFISEDKKTYSYIINDAVFKSHIQVIKTDAETGKNILCAGVGFEIYDPDGKKIIMKSTYPSPTQISTFYTDEKGTLITPEELPYGKGYSLIETKAPYGYVLDKEPVFFDIKEKSSEEEDNITIVKIKKENRPQKGTIILYKTGEYFQGVKVETREDGQLLYQPVYERGYAKGAEFEIYAETDIYTPDGTLRYKKGQKVDKICTGADGKAQSTALYLGKYLIKEVKAPVGQVLDPGVYKAELTYAGQQAELTETVHMQENNRQKAKVSFVKELEKDKTFRLGSEKELEKVRFGLFAGEELISVSGTSIPKDGLIEILEPDKTGKVDIHTELPLGKFYIKELCADEHYQISSEIYPFEFIYEDMTQKEVSIRVNQGKHINNRLIYGTVEGKKVDEEGRGLAGAVIGLFQEGIEEPVMVCESAEDGLVRFEKIPYGKWIIRELKPPVGYEHSDTEIEVEISSQEQKVSFVLENRKIRGMLELTKIDAEYPDNKLTGAEFAVYIDKNENGKKDKEDQYLGDLEEEEKGVYRKKDLCYGRYLIKEKKAPSGFKPDQKVYPVFIEEGKTYRIENDRGVGFSNKAKTGSLKIIKTSSDGEVEGFLFHIKGDNGYEIFMETDKNGEIYIENLRLGKYIVSEVRNHMTEEYHCPKDKQLEIQEDRCAEVEMHNKRIKVPQTGDKIPLMKWILSFLVALSFIVFYPAVRTRFKKKR